MAASFPPAERKQCNTPQERHWWCQGRRCSRHRHLHHLHQALQQVNHNRNTFNMISQNRNKQFICWKYFLWEYLELQLIIIYAITTFLNKQLINQNTHKGLWWSGFTCVHPEDTNPTPNCNYGSKCKYLCLLIKYDHLVFMSKTHVFNLKCWDMWTRGEQGVRRLGRCCSHLGFWVILKDGVFAELQGAVCRPACWPSCCGGGRRSSVTGRFEWHHQSTAAGPRRGPSPGFSMPSDSAQLGVNAQLEAGGGREVTGSRSEGVWGSVNRPGGETKVSAWHQASYLSDEHFICTLLLLHRQQRHKNWEKSKLKPERASVFRRMSNIWILSEQISTLHCC